LAFVFQTKWSWSGATIEALIEAGIALSFVGLAFLFERRFVKGIAQVATDAAQVSFAKQAGDLQTRIDQLTDAVRERRRQEADDQDEVISALDYPSLSNIIRAFEEASKLRALADGLVRVSASADRDLLTLSFGRWRQQGSILEIVISPQALARVHPPSLPILRWMPEQTAESVGFEISHVIQRQGLLDNPDDFDWSRALRNLRDSFAVAIKSRRRDPGEWLLHGQPYEFLETDWAVTTEGLEYRLKRDFLIMKNEFFQRQGPARDTRREAEVLRALLDKRPEWCSEDDWAWLIRRAQAYY
jgi:hypothetical protein